MMILGASSVGKTALIKRYALKYFPENHSPTIQNMYEKYLRVNEVVYKLKIFDFGGHIDQVEMIM